MNTNIFTQNSAQDVPLDTLDKETIAQEVQESVLRRVVSEILQEDKEETSKWAKAAAGGVIADLQVGGNLSLSNTKITSLPAGLKVGGDIYGFTGDISQVPQRLKEKII